MIIENSHDLSRNWLLRNFYQKMLTTALILAGHGSHISPHTAGLIWRHVDRLRAMGIADEVTAAFWKEMPSFHTVLNSVSAQDITIVPMFTARGYFTQTVIPAEMGLEGAVTQRDGRVIRYTRTLGEHPYLSTVVQLRVETAIQTFALPRDQTAVAIIGHSTRRNPESRQATETQAQNLRDLNCVAQVQAVYLDDSPEIPEIYRLTDAKHLIAVPYFLAAGSHTTIDVPEALLLEAGETRGSINGREVYYTAPVGVDDDLLNLILTLARESGAPLNTPSQCDVWSGFPQAGRDRLIATVQTAGSLKFGGLQLSMNDVHAWGDSNPHEAILSPSLLRTRVRENPFRSLATRDDLPQGWHVPIESPEQLHAVVETIYPGVLGDWAAGDIGTFEANIARQTGMVRSLDSLSSEKQSALVGRVCASCVRFPSWYNPHHDPTAIPCPEPCNHWLSAALEESI